jgi:hypothetical protein
MLIHPLYQQLSSSVSPMSGSVSPVDIRTFYPYTPNEVKHRKRTSRAQLKVLEDHFRRDTKPNASLRKSLADQLDMSVRGVQVWFQNRRAKEKALASKALSSRHPPPIASHPSPDDDDDQPDSPPLPHSPSESHQSSSSASIPIEPPIDSSNSSPASSSLPPIQSDSSSSWYNPPSPQDDPAFNRQSGSFDLSDSHLVNLRRGSLPAYPQSPDPHFASHFNGDLDLLGRRRSVDTSLLRLATHPYAQHARARNGAIFGGRFYSPQGRFTDPSPFYPVGRSPANLHNIRPRQLNSSVHSLVPIHRPYDFGGPTSCVPPSSSSLTPFHAVRATLPGNNNHHHVMSMRTVSSPLPGPLPSPGFSFGAANSSPPQIPSPIERDSPDPMPEYPFSFPRRLDDTDAEDDATSASYDAFSRFGSISSYAGSESSNTSAYSDVGSCDFPYKSDGRRGSRANGPFLNMMSGLEVTPPNDAHATPYLPQEEIGTSATPIPTDRLGLHGTGDGQVTAAYPSPSSTVSPGGTPHTQDTNPPCLPISRSSELAFALHTNEDAQQQQRQQKEMSEDVQQQHQRLLRHPEPQQIVSDAPAPPTSDDGPSTAQFYYVSDAGNDAGTMYPPVEPPATIMNFSTDKFTFDGDMAQLTSNSSAAAAGHFHASYSTSVDAGTYAADGTFVAGDPSDVFSTYNTAAAAAAGTVTTVDPSSLEGAHNPYT